MSYYKRRKKERKVKHFSPFTIPVLALYHYFNSKINKNETETRQKHIVILEQQKNEDIHGGNQLSVLNFEP